MTDSPYARFAASACAMGRAVARATEPDFRDDWRDDFDWDAVSPNGLATRDAWAMATHWNTQLSGHVSVSVDDAAARFEVVPSIEWVDVWLGCMEDESGQAWKMEATARAARAASLVWRALAACRGFGVAENPGFWKRLFSEMERSSYRSTNNLTHVSKRNLLGDHTRFFTGLVFPRLRLNLGKGEDSGVGYDEHAMRIFAGCEDKWSITGFEEGGEEEDGKEELREENETKEANIEHQDQLEESRTLAKILRRLAPIVQTQRRCVANPVDVVLRPGVAQLEEDTLQKYITIINSTERYDHATTLDLLNSPHLRVRAIDPRPYNLANEAERLTHARGLEVPITSVSISRPSYVTQHHYDNLPARLEFRDYLREMLRMNSDGPGGVQNFTFNHESEHYSIPAILSALPHTRSVETLALARWNDWSGSFPLQDVRWLGYALFHPDSASSTWRRLRISGLGIERNLRAVEDLTRMARGNNLGFGHRLLKNIDVVGAYFTATIRDGAVIYERQDENSNAVETVAGVNRFDVCVASTNVTLLDEWVFVIVPAYGEAWVRSSEIIGIDARPPGSPFLAGFVADCSALNLEVKLMLIKMAGQELECLNVWYGFLDTARDILQDIGTSCPRLRRLTIILGKNDGLLHDLILPVTLQELSLTVQLSKEPLVFAGSALATLQDLRTVRLVMNRAPTDEDVTSFVLPLLRTLRKVQCFQWVDNGSLWSCELRKNLTYAQRCFVTSQIFSALEPADYLAVLEDTPPNPTIVALLGSSALGPLSQELVQHIGSFVGRSVKREIVVHGTWFLRRFW